MPPVDQSGKNLGFALIGVPIAERPFEREDKFSQSFVITIEDELQGLPRFL